MPKWNVQRVGPQWMLDKDSRVVGLKDDRGVFWKIPMSAATAAEIEALTDPVNSVSQAPADTWAALLAAKAAGGLVKRSTRAVDANSGAGAFASWWDYEPAESDFSPVGRVLPFYKGQGSSLASPWATSVLVTGLANALATYPALPPVSIGLLRVGTRIIINARGRRLVGTGAVSASIRFGTLNTVDDSQGGFVAVATTGGTPSFLLRAEIIITSDTTYTRRQEVNSGTWLTGGTLSEETSGFNRLAVNYINFGSTGQTTVGDSWCIDNIDVDLRY